MLRVICGKTLKNKLNLEKIPKRRGRRKYKAPARAEIVMARTRGEIGQQKSRYNIFNWMDLGSSKKRRKDTCTGERYNYQNSLMQRLLTMETWQQ